MRIITLDDFTSLAKIQHHKFSRFKTSLGLHSSSLRGPLWQKLLFYNVEEANDVGTCKFVSSYSCPHLGSAASMYLEMRHAVISL